ncbi:MAG TPA: hypothetical protein PLC99_05375 [Verrucomicrobiota bacterium]|nr:hypothetical protein [Verrucomicrobiota bacterium]
MRPAGRTQKSAAAGTPSRAGSYMHTLQAMAPGEGFGVVCTACNDGVGSVYEVAVTQPNFQVAEDSIFGVCSTNCAIGGLSGGGGSETNTTAFQAANSVDKWGVVCWLTNTAGVLNPQIEFHYVSGTDPANSLKQYADCVKFTLISASTNPAPVRITDFRGTSLTYTGGVGARFVLRQSTSLSDAPGSWPRVATNFVTPGTFDPLPVANTPAPCFYCIQSE